MNFQHCGSSGDKRQQLLLAAAKFPSFLGFLILYGEQFLECKKSNLQRGLPSSFTHTWQKENLPTSYNLQNRFCFDPMLATTASHWLKMSKNVSSVIKLQFKFFLKKVWIFQLRYQFQISWWAFFWHFQPKCFPVLSRASSRIKGKQAKNSSTRDWCRFQTFELTHIKVSLSL